MVMEKVNQGLSFRCLQSNHLWVMLTTEFLGFVENLTLRQYAKPTRHAMGCIYNPTCTARLLRGYSVVIGITFTFPLFLGASPHHIKMFVPSLLMPSASMRPLHTAQFSVCVCYMEAAKRKRALRLKHTVLLMYHCFILTISVKYKSHSCIVIPIHVYCSYRELGNVVQQLQHKKFLCQWPTFTVIPCT